MVFSQIVCGRRYLVSFGDEEFSGLCLKSVEGG